MSDVTMNKKLQLVQQVRNQYNQNQYDLESREQILYGRTSNRMAMERTDKLDDTIPEKIGTFRLRLTIALMLLFSVLILDINGQAIFGIQTKTIFSYIAKDFTRDTLDFIEDFTYTLQE